MRLGSEEVAPAGHGKEARMSPTLVIASVAITAALVLYTAGVLSERRGGRLTGGNLALFWAGLVCDTTGTTLMTMMANAGGGQGAPAIHGITGALAIVLMLFHAVWATVTFVRCRRADEAAERRSAAFNRFSTVVWLLWLVPYVIGLLVGIPMIELGTVPAVVVSVLVVAVVAAITYLPGIVRSRRG